MKQRKSPTYIIGIETSCDDTAVSVIKASAKSIRVLSSIVSSQTKLHAKWGGVVPNLAAREHLKNIIPVFKLALKEARVSPALINMIAATHGPGLIPSLLIGTNVAKTLAYVWQKPLLGVHHIEGHIYANFIGDKISVSSKFQIPNSKQILNSKLKSSKINFPILCLVVSGGHTQLILMKKHLDYEVVGETLDDAAGEAFDKVARILGLGYPGGPAISQFAAKWKSEIRNPKSEINTKYKILNTKYAIKLPRPMINKNNLNFSFSGLKTAVLYETKKNQKLLKNKNYIAAMCAEFQQAVIDVLIHKTLKAAGIYKPKTVMLAGGVSANQELRKQMGKIIQKNIPESKFIIPDSKYCIDNAAMIAVAGYFRWKNMSATQKKKTFNNWKIIQPDANLKL